MEPPPHRQYPKVVSFRRAEYIDAHTVRYR